MSRRSTRNGGTKRTAEFANLDEKEPERSKNPNSPDFNTKIPIDVKEKIFTFLSFNDLMTATLVCKQWNRIISDDVKCTNKIVYPLPCPLFTRRYIHLDIRKLPPKSECENKLAPIRLQVTSIKITAKQEFSKIKAFLDSFPNLKSLELYNVHWKDDCFKNEQDQTTLNLHKLKHYGVIAESSKFAAFALSAIPSTVSLNSMKFYLGNDNSRVFYPLMMKSLVALINNQSSLECLHLAIESTPPFQMEEEFFEPRFELKELTLYIKPYYAHQEILSIYHKLLRTCINRCTTLDIDFSSAFRHAFLSILAKMKVLEDLKYRRHPNHSDFNHNDDSVTFNPPPVLLPNFTESRLKTLNFCGSRWQAWQAMNAQSEQVLLTLLNLHGSSVEELTLENAVKDDSPIWNIIGQQMKKLRKLTVHYLTKKMLDKFSDSSIESLVETRTTRWASVQKKALELLADKDYWAEFTAKNPNFKSVVIAAAEPFEK